MALRNQPYLPLYVQDYLTDEKLNMCSWQTQGIYIKIMCILHKQKSYGEILFKQTTKQKASSTLNFVYEFAEILVKQIPCKIDDMVAALDELLFREVLTLEDGTLYQRRMVKDGQISELRSLAAKKGGGNPNLFKQKHSKQFKQTSKQNPEGEDEYVNENVIDKEKGVKGEKRKSNFIELPFSSVEFSTAWEDWKHYKRKEHKFKYASEQSEKASLTELFNLSSGNGEIAVRIIQQSMAKGWKGLFELSQEQNGKPHGKPGKLETLASTVEQVAREFQTEFQTQNY